MMRNPIKLTKSKCLQRFFRPIKSSNLCNISILRRLVGRAGASVSWLIQAAVDFLIEDRCMICGELCYPIQGPVDPSPSFSTCFTQGVKQPVCGFAHITNHPFCRDCVSELDETHSPGVIRMADGRNRARPGTCPTAGVPQVGERAISQSMQSPMEADECCMRIPVISPFMTNDAVLKLVHLVKFSAYMALVPPVARSIQKAFDRYRSEELDYCVLVPVPMHIKQKKRRGFNQAERIARELSRGLNIPLQPESLMRHRLGAPQSMTPHEKRAANVQDAFSVKKGSVTRKHVLLVDDLVTTGATAAACSSGLFAAGAESVTVLCLGRSL